MGLAMGLTAIAIIYSPMGKQSGAHFNPAVTLTFHRLGKISSWDAVFYIGAQFLGAIGGVAIMELVGGAILRHQSVNYVATLPGPWGGPPAFLAEAGISFVMMTMVLAVSNHPRWARFTGIAAGLLVALFIFVEAPVSGMSMNPARSFGSAAIPGLWTNLWIYFLAPTAGMLLAAQLKERVGRKSGIFCAKLHHTESKRCIFCNHQRGEL
jgi:aquaporin Z